MGACFDSGFYRETDKHTVREAFENDQEIDRYENGHCYSGSIGMATGAKFLDNMVFGNKEDAEDYIAETAQKWGPALFVKVVNENEEGWFFGAWCSS